MKSAQGRVFTAEMAAIVLDYGNAPAILVALNDISQRKEMEAELFRQASTDSLTGISNRRYFENQAEQEVRRARRFARDMTVMMIDIDHFKAINDTHGHAIGDAVIQGVVKRALESLRQSDSIGRIGGEEFAVLLPETSLAAAYDVAERLRVHMQEKPIIAGHTIVPCTVSIGVGQLSAQDGGIEDLLHRADIALYAAKKGGRNRVEIAAAPLKTLP
jgi:diguanylate cyclase (GGDEF)-like protein